METIKDFKGYADDRVIAKFSRINITNHTKELAGYICWDFIEEQKRMMYFCTDPSGKIVTPYADTREEAMNRSAEYILKIMQKDISENEAQNIKPSAERTNEIKDIRDNKLSGKDNEINR